LGVQPERPDLEDDERWRFVGQPAGRPVASGLYFYRLESDSFAEVRKMTLLK
jgi:hypothetical protein